jgi:hypothetical protein
MKRIIYVLLFVSPLMNACAPWCKGKKGAKNQEKQIAIRAEKTVVEQPVISISAKQADIAHLNDQLFRAVNARECDMVQQLIDANADVQAVDPDDQKSSTRKAADSLLIAYEKEDTKKKNAYITIISMLKNAGAHQSEDLRPFMTKEPFKSHYMQQLIDDGCKEEDAEKILNNAVNDKSSPPDHSEKKDDSETK